jgi:hypothetical protein
MLWFRAALAIAWLVMVWLSAQAILQMGANAAGDVFLGDFTHPWRGQFNGDFAFHLALMAAWIAFREKSPIRGVPFAVASIVFGGVFSFAYIFLATFGAQGDVRRLLLGARA